MGYFVMILQLVRIVCDPLAFLTGIGLVLMTSLIVNIQSTVILEGFTTIIFGTIYFLLFMLCFDMIRKASFVFEAFVTILNITVEHYGPMCSPHMSFLIGFVSVNLVTLITFDRVNY